MPRNTSSNSKGANACWSISLFRRRRRVLLRRISYPGLPPCLWLSFCGRIAASVAIALLAPLTWLSWSTAVVALPPHSNNNHNPDTATAGGQAPDTPSSRPSKKDYEVPASVCSAHAGIPLPSCSRASQPFACPVPSPQLSPYRLP